MPILIFAVLPYLILELWVRTSLFDHALYSNSEALDASWRALAARTDWNIVTIGDSEVRWGFDPEMIDRALHRAGLAARAFNLGIDGFSGDLYRAILPDLDLPRRLPELRVAIIGVQLIEPVYHRRIDGYGDIGCDGALHRPILLSPMARDLGFDRFCVPMTWEERILRGVEDVSAVIRYRKALRAAILGPANGEDAIRFQSTALEHRPDGFQPNRPIAEARQNFEHGMEYISHEKRERPDLYAPLDPQVWEKAVSPGDYFDVWADYFVRHGILPAFVALPTNPLLIDFKERRADYARNSALLAGWAARTGEVYIDLGIQDDFDPELDYSDRRHLSWRGAEKFSSELGEALAASAAVRAALRKNKD